MKKSILQVELTSKRGEILAVTMETIKILSVKGSKTFPVITINGSLSFLSTLKILRKKFTSRYDPIRGNNKIAKPLT